MAYFTFFIDAVTSGFVWFTQVFTAAGLLDIFSGLIIITFIFYRLIAPLLRSAGSDRASKSRSKSGESE